MKYSSFLLYFVVIIIMVIPKGSYAQTSDNKKYILSIKPSISTVNSVEKMYKTALYDDYKKNRINYGLDFNYKFSDRIDVGLYVSYSKLLQPYLTSGSIGFNFNNSNAFYYGINSEVHLIPLFFGVNNYKIDIYGVMKIGVVSEYWHPYDINTYDSNELLSKRGVEIGLGLGVSYMLTKRVGMFIECNIGKYYNDDFTRIRTGLKVNL